MAWQALDTAQGFLRRFTDPITLNECDDLAQTAAMQAWRHAANLRRQDRFAAMVRTISRRLRVRAIGGVRRFARRHVRLDDGLVAVLPSPGLTTELCVRGEPVAVDWLLAQLRQVLAAWKPLDGELLRGFHGGQTCAQLAASHGLALAAVKRRLCRGRRRLQQALENRARVAGLLG